MKGDIIIIIWQNVNDTKMTHKKEVTEDQMEHHRTNKHKCSRITKVSVICVNSAALFVDGDELRML